MPATPLPASCRCALRIAAACSRRWSHCGRLQVECEVAEWSEWAQCDAATGRKERTRPIVTQPEGGTACPLLEEVSACSRAERLLRFIINGVLDNWNWVFVGLLTLLSSGLQSEIRKGMWLMIKKVATWAASAALSLLFPPKVRQVRVCFG
jgi:hypothetical protein